MVRSRGVIHQRLRIETAINHGRQKFLLEIYDGDAVSSTVFCIESIRHLESLESRLLFDWCPIARGFVSPARNPASLGLQAADGRVNLYLVASDGRTRQISLSHEEWLVFTRPLNAV